MLIETKRSLNKDCATVGCDNAKQFAMIAKKIFKFIIHTQRIGELI